MEEIIGCFKRFGILNSIKNCNICLHFPPRSKDCVTYTNKNKRFYFIE